MYQGREDLVLRARELACATPGASLEEACRDADVIVGLSRGGLVTPDMLKAMAPSPVVFALANPEPEIRPERALATRADVVIATGRSDYPNQVNNVLGFPYIFRGALDVRASCINNEMKLAAVSALQALAHEPLITPSFQVPVFGPAALIPLPFDPRLCERVSAAVAEAARVSGVARL